jgi:hypothetical protein
MTGATAFFVQFPHPGVEHRTVLDVMPWNVGNHRRKFVRSAARYVDQYGELLAGDLTFWGEWEPPSRVERRWPRDGQLPRTLHIPYWTRETLATSARDAEMLLTLYRSATFDDPVEGMFSFLPARLADAADARFARPRARLPGLINPANRQSTWGSTRPLPVDSVRDASDSIRDQVVAQGLHLGTRIGIPPEVG